MIRPHVINLRAGKFLGSGDFATTAADVDAIFSKHLPASKKKKVLFWAHGGLVPEAAALQHVIDHLAGWMAADVYPIYFVWETDLMTSLRDLLLGMPREADRGFGDFLVDRSDALLQTVLHYPALKVWSQMKEYARIGCDSEGGARYAAKKAAAYAAANPDVEFYACGHSAGSIFHAWFLPVAIDLGVRFKDLFLLAPAITVPDFETHLAGRIGSGKGISRSTLFTMNETAELADNTAKVYRKSLLYFVSRACEPAQPTPILGLEESIKASAALRRLFGVGTPSDAGEVVWSPSGQTAGICASNATSHGGFDNDYTTLNSMARRISGNTALNVFEPEAERSLEAGDLLPQPAASRGVRKPRRRAVCIGIDDYPASPLHGCVNDATDWSAALGALGFDTELLTNGQATRNGLVRAISDLIEGSLPGDVLVLQYAGHGTHVDDVDGDETDDDQDEALVPFDYASGNFLIDDDIGDLLDRVPPGVNFTCFMDCCHSGTNTRFLLPRGAKNAGELSRYLPVPREIVRQHVINRKAAPPRGPRSALAGKPEVSFAACRPDQTAKEINGHGYFTTVATKILRDGIQGLTHEQFLQQVNAAFPLPRTSQEPQLNCDEGRNAWTLLQPHQTTARAEDAGAPVAAGAVTDTDARLVLEVLRDAMQVLRKMVG